MHLSEFKLENYKSIRSSDSLSFTPGFNVIVGQNNVGKTALVEGLSLQFANHPHRSLKTLPDRDTPSASSSWAYCTVHFPGDEIKQVLLTQPQIIVPLHATGDDGHTHDYFHALLRTGADLGFRWEAGTLHDPQVQQYPQDSSGSGLRYVPRHDADGWIWEKHGPCRLEQQSTFIDVLAQRIPSRIYAFRAERSISGEAPIAESGDLVPNAANLAAVLHYLQTERPDRFDQFKRLVRDVFPHIQQIRVPLRNAQIRIYIGTLEPSEGREDLDVPLAASGTGIGQVLAMLYVVFASDYPRIIVIDEPQSFLHPGAIYRLFDILKTAYSHHQYILTTHAPAVVAAADPMTIHLLSWSHGETQIVAVDHTKATDLSYVLAELGARLTDVFGAERLLWVEGPTEEKCFPLICQKLTKSFLLGTRILGIVHTGDLESKDPDRIFQIYERLSQGSALAPQTVRFLLDRERRTETQREDLTRRSKGAISFLERCMYENYLLDPEAIAVVLNAADPSGTTHVTANTVQEWLQSHGSGAKLFPQGTSSHAFPGRDWDIEVHGARVLAVLFSELSECRVAYEKIRHGVDLTRWFLNHKPETLQPIADAISALLEHHIASATVGRSA